ncbi:unnamed protein product, partial [marine sediment metagenome]
DDNKDKDHKYLVRKPFKSHRCYPSHWQLLPARSLFYTI